MKNELWRLDAVAQAELVRRGDVTALELLDATIVPIGSHFAAPLGQERILLELAYQIERAGGWADRWPHTENGLVLQTVPR